MNGRLRKALAGLLPGKRWGVIALPYLWMLLFFAVPFLIVLRISFSMRDQTRSPPYTPILEYVQSAVTMKLNLSHYVTLVTDSLYIEAFGSSLWIAAVSTILIVTSVAILMSAELLRQRSERMRTSAIFEDAVPTEVQ